MILLPLILGAALAGEAPVTVTFAGTVAGLDGAVPDDVTEGEALSGCLRYPARLGGGGETVIAIETGAHRWSIDSGFFLLVEAEAASGGYTGSLKIEARAEPGATFGGGLDRHALAGRFAATGAAPPWDAGLRALPRSAEDLRRANLSGGGFASSVGQQAEWTVRYTIEPASITVNGESVLPGGAGPGNPPHPCSDPIAFLVQDALG